MGFPPLLLPPPPPQIGTDFGELLRATPAFSVASRPPRLNFSIKQTITCHSLAEDGIGITNESAADCARRRRVAKGSFVTRAEAAQRGLGAAWQEGDEAGLEGARRGGRE